jgi:phenylacetate-CoA ligase
MGIPATRGAAAALLPSDAQHRLIAIFQRAAEVVPAYRALLARHGVTASAVSDLSLFSSLVPVLTKADTFDAVAIDQLGSAVPATDIASVFTGSGRNAPFAFGLTTRGQAEACVASADALFDAAFGVSTRTTLAINCLPMGIGFSSRAMTVATTSVREDMVIGLVQAFGRYYDQLLLIGDPLFLKRLTDYAQTLAVDWTPFRVNVIVCDESFGEHYRSYLASCFSCELTDTQPGFIMSTYDVSELGTHLGYETHATVALRRAAHADPRFADALLGVTRAQALPTILAFNPQRTFLEIRDADAAGYGWLTASTLEPERRIPLLRYQTGDVAALVDRGHACMLVEQYGIDLPEPLPPAMIALRDRDRAALPNGFEVGVYKDILYADPSVARSLTGAVRLAASRNGVEMHLQLVPGAPASAALQRQLSAQFPSDLRPERQTLWPYAQFPYSMTLDYERKFTFYVPGEPPPQASRV